MNSQNFCSYFSYSYPSFTNLFLTGVLACGSLLLFWKFMSHVCEVATTVSGIRYVPHERRCIKMNTEVLSPFHFQVDFTTASFSGVKCVLKCDEVCYVQALWGVPIYFLIEHLNKDWKDLINSATGLETPDKFTSKCVHVDKHLVLADNVEKILEFKLPSHVDQAKLFTEAMNSRTFYPFVVLMVLTQQNELPKYSNPYVIASANALHLPDKVLNKCELIAQFIRLSSGHIGQIKKIYCSSSDEERTDDLCLICYQKPVSVVQLSCRHFCLCRSCYQRCDKCPLCRNANMDYFELPVY